MSIILLKTKCCSGINGQISYVVSTKNKNMNWRRSVMKDSIYFKVSPSLNSKGSRLRPAGYDSAAQ